MSKSRLNELSEQIERKLRASEEAVQAKQEGMNRLMLELERREVEFSKAAARLLEEVVRPAVQVFAGHFDNAQIDSGTISRLVRCDLQPTTRFPATAHLSFHVLHNDGFTRATVTYDSHVLPVFIQFPGRDSIDVPLENVDQEVVRQWCERKLVEFVDAYLLIETHEQYQRGNYAIDPVCGMSVMKSQAVTLSRGGMPVYFCSDRCLDRFAHDPKAYGSKASS